ncbi:MAG: peptidoglycan DD-metalloendopeptidase family protein [Bilophila sp.]
MRIKWLLCRVVLVCVVLVGVTGYVSTNESFRQALPPVFQSFFDGVAQVMHSPWSEPDTEHALDAFDADTTEVQPDQPDQTDQEDPTTAETDKDEEEPGPHVYDPNPRFTVELDPEQGEVLRSEILTGDTSGGILGLWLDPNEREAAINAAKPVYPLTKVRVGQPFAIVREPGTGAFRAFKYEVDQKRILLVARSGDGFTAKMEDIDYTTTLTRVRGTITTTLSEAVVDMGESIGLAIALADVFASEINFITDLRVGDTFEVLVEKQFRRDDFRGYGKVIGARFTNQGKLHAAYLFHNERGKLVYYDAKGENLHRALLKAPLSFLRVTSQYSMARRHPVFGTVRPHQGIDYGAPRGTPVMAVGDGVLTNVGRAGGYGKQIILKHANGLESYYGHLSRFAKGMTSGKRVRQGQTIGYVGATGTATGPHLDFRIKNRGNFVNPAKLVVPRDTAIERKRMKQFKTLVRSVDAYWEGQELSKYDPDTWFEDAR